MVECPKCGNTLTFVDNYYVIGVKCEKCLISALKDNKSDLDISNEESYQNLLKKYNSIKDVEKNEENNFSSMDEYQKVIGSSINNVKEIEKDIIEEKCIDPEDVKQQLENKKQNLSVENKSILDSKPTNTNLKQSEYFVEILRYVENSIKNGKKFIIVNAPTGIGKSHIAATLCKFFKEGVILTEQISLQQQYIQNFSWMNQVKGMGNFSCPDLEWEKTANYGNCEGCKFRCDTNDFQIKNKGTEQETVSVIENSRFGIGLSKEILENENNLEIIPEKEKTILAESMLTKTELDKQNESLNRFAIKYDQKFFFVLPEEKIPKESEVQKNDGQLVTRENEICPYYQQRMVGEIGNFAVYNYAMYISTMLGKSTDSENTRPRQILICDEAHNLEDKLKNEGTIELDLHSINKIIDDKNILDEIGTNTIEKNILQLISNLDQLLSMLEKKYDEFRKHRTCIKFLNSKIHIDKHRGNYCQKHKRIIKKCQDCSILKKEIENGKFLGCNDHVSPDKNTECNENHSRFTEKYVKKIKEERKNLRSSMEIIKKIHKKFGNEQNNFVLQFDKFKNKITIQPTIVSETAQTLFSNFNHVVFLSSTIHKEIFVKDMGIDDYVFKSFPNPIPLDNRIVMMDTSPLNKWELKKNPKKVDEQYKVIAQKIIRILNNHKNEKGLILVNSYNPDLNNLLSFLKDVKNRLTYNENKVDRNSPEITNSELLKIHESKENSVLFSASMWEGVDLKEDLGKFCIIATSPFMPEKEEKNPYAAVKNRRNNDGKEWSSMRNAFKFVQGIGRCVRGIDDRAVTYVLDDGCKKHKNWLDKYIEKDSNSKWFTDSFEDY